ncbi:MAG: O-antigen ligase family protein [Bacteroidales bacterium]|nr:O-antigen ligase family protein [Bacteroidales bacterium]MBN2757442.1 O-antigen ligase family protein [Bacteroidales bacterium]
MNTNWLKYKYITSNLNFFATLLFVFWLPLKADFLPAIMSFWIFTWLLEGNFKYRFNNFPNKSIYFAILFYFILNVLALLYSSNIDNGLYEIQKKLSMLLFPLIIIGSNDKLKNNYQIILTTFVIGNLIASIYLLSNAFFSNLIIENGSWYIKHWHWKGFEQYSFWQLVNMRISNFSASFFSVLLHPSYFAMYIIFSITILIYQFKNKIYKKKFNILIFSTIAFFLFIIYLLQSRAGFLSLFFVIIFLVLFELKIYRNKRLLLGGLILIIIGFSFIFFSINMQSGFSKLNNLLSKENKMEMIKQDTRFETWFSAIEIIKENFWFGTSPDRLSDELSKKYIKYNFFDAEDHKLNTHNQYLESFASLGIFGIISLLIILILGIYHSLKTKNYLLFYLILILSINFLFEAILNRIAGAIFMMFFYSIFTFSDINKLENTKKVNF